jgi:hypothetical protein
LKAYCKHPQMTLCFLHLFVLETWVQIAFPKFLWIIFVIYLHSVNCKFWFIGRRWITVDLCKDISPGMTLFRLPGVNLLTWIFRILTDNPIMKVADGTFDYLSSLQSL